MNIEQKMEWLRPERIQKLYDGQKSPFGMNRLFVIGIGKTVWTVFCAACI